MPEIDVTTDAKPPKKGGFDLGKFLKPVAEVDTLLGKIYLFPLRVSDLEAFTSLTVTDTVGRTREMLLRIASMYPDCGLNHKRVALTPDQVCELTDCTIEVIADAYSSSNGLRSAREGEKERAPIVKAMDESATAYLGRLLQSELEEQAKQSQKLREQILSYTSGTFDQVRKASQALGDTRLQFERLTKASARSIGAAPLINDKSLEPRNHMAEHSARWARERAEDREIVRLTGQMTAQSAETLQTLAVAATTMLETLDIRDKESKKTTKLQLWIAVGSVVISALLALLALIVSNAAYYQDKENIYSGDKWQASVLEELQAANQKSFQVEAENRLLLDMVDQIRARIVEMEPRPIKEPTTSKNVLRQR